MADGGQVGQSLSIGSLPHKGHLRARRENASVWRSVPSGISDGAACAEKKEVFTHRTVVVAPRV